MLSVKTANNRVNLSQGVHVPVHPPSSNQPTSRGLIPQQASRFGFPNADARCFMIFSRCSTSQSKSSVIRSCTEVLCMPSIQKSRSWVYLNTLEKRLRKQANDANKALNAFISAAGRRPGFVQEIRESDARYKNGSLWVNVWILDDG